MRLFIQVLMIAALGFFLFNPGSNISDETLVPCWHHHCEFGDQLILCYRPVYDCELQNKATDHSDLELSCVPSDEYNPPKPDLFCENDFFSDCTCGYRKSGAKGEFNRTEHAHCMCEMNFKSKATIVILVVAFVLLVGVLAGSLGLRLWFIRRKYDVDVIVNKSGKANTNSSNNYRRYD